jgi:hypothetical protein
MAMTRTEALYYQIFENEGTVGIMDHICEWRMRHVEEMLKLFREAIDTMKLKWLCHKNNICWGCIKNTQDIAEFLETKTIPVGPPMSWQPVGQAKYMPFKNYGFTYTKVEGKNLGAAEELCLNCISSVIDMDSNENSDWENLVQTGENSTSISSPSFADISVRIQGMRLHNIILQPKHFMLIGIFFKYMLVKGSLGKNYYDDTMEFTTEYRSLR